MKKKLSLFMIATAAVWALALQHRKTKLFQQMRLQLLKNVITIFTDIVDLSAGYSITQEIFY